MAGISRRAFVAGAGVVATGVMAGQGVCPAGRGDCQGGAWKNMLDPDPVKRKDNVTYVTGKLALAEMLGARNCVDIAGSYDANVWYGQNRGNLRQDFIDATVENCRKLIDAVKPQRTFFSIEMMPWTFPTDPDEYVKLVKAVDRSENKALLPGRVPHVRPSVHGPKTDSSNAFTLCARTLALDRTFPAEAERLWGLRPVFFGPCTLGRTWGTRPEPRTVVGDQNLLDPI